MTKPSSITENVVPMANPRRIATRARICEVASALFFEKGFAATTMDEVAKAAVIRRSTLYLHFHEKEEILDAIAKDFTEKLRAIVARLPGPVPTREEISRWVREFAKFVVGERAATELLVSLSHLPNAPAAAITFGNELKAMMADRVAAFRKAQEPGQHKALAWSITVMDGLGWALCHHARSGGCELSRARLEVAVECLERFVRGEF